jgi:hypothetical protein
MKKMSVLPIQSDAPQRTGLRVTYEEFLELGEEYRHSEWVNGEVVRAYLLRTVSDENGSGFARALA